MHIQTTNPLTKHAGIDRVQKLYLQLLYKCQFRCDTCFQGNSLGTSEMFPLSQAQSLISYFQTMFGITEVLLLGGEPFLYSDLENLLTWIKGQNLSTTVISNGFHVDKTLPNLHTLIDHLRISIDGQEEDHDGIRKTGSFQQAQLAVQTAVALGLKTTITSTVTATNHQGIPEMIRQVANWGASSVKLHCLRPVGNAADHPELFAFPQNWREQLLHSLGNLPVPVYLDEDLSPCTLGNSQYETSELERIEVQPNGDLYVSCKAVGDKSNAFKWDKQGGRLLYLPHHGDEIQRKAPQVHYVVS